MAIKLDNYYDDQYDKGVKRISGLANTQIKQVNQNYDEQNATASANADKQILAGSNSYESAYNDNAVQRAINERQIRTSFANAGLSDSGLNATQLTAVELQKANADNKVTMQKNAFISNIRSQLQETIRQNNIQRNNEINTINNQKTADINALRNEQDKMKNEKVEEIIKNIASMTDPTLAAGYIKTVSKQYGIDPMTLAAYSPVVSKKSYKKYLESESYFTNRDGYKGTLNAVTGIDTTTGVGKTSAAKTIYSSAKQYKLDEGQIKKLCKAAGISYNDYQKYTTDDKNIFKRKEGYETTMSTVAGLDTTTASGQTVAAKQIKSAESQFKLTKTQVKKLCAAAGISYSDYQKFLKDGQIFKKREDSKKVSASTTKTTSKTGGGRGGKKQTTTGYKLDNNTGGGKKKTASEIVNGVLNKKGKNGKRYSALYFNTGDNYLRKVAAGDLYNQGKISKQEYDACKQVWK